MRVAMSRLHATFVRAKTAGYRAVLVGVAVLVATPGRILGPNCVDLGLASTGEDREPGGYISGLVGRWVGLWLGG